ncbi:MAG: hypothetical protein M1834_009640 [Cirrosporium novae-zelandiae]|nr:MAG: hypothetical protein M1834_009640 [Cirrosporium novae-zelandiae]
MSSTPMKARRRVLGDLNTNAPITPLKLKSNTTSSQIISKQHLQPMANASPTHAGQKRKLGDVANDENSAEARHGLAKQVSQSPTSHREQIEPRSPSEPIQVLSSQPTTVIHDASRSDSEIIPTVIPSSVNNSQESFGMSSLIDFDPEQESASQKLATPSPERPSKRRDIKQKAEEVRLRLKLALFRVETSQVNVPLSELQIPSPPRSASKPTPRAPTLLPAPILKEPSHLTQISRIPSSPPEPSSYAIRGEEATLTTARTKQMNPMATPPNRTPTSHIATLPHAVPDNQSQEEGNEKGKVQGRDEADVADGLLDLMRSQ